MKYFFSIINKSFIDHLPLVNCYQFAYANNTNWKYTQFYNSMYYVILYSNTNHDNIKYTYDTAPIVLCLPIN